MLTFEDSFHSDGLVSCFICANEPRMGRVCFYIGPIVLQDVLHGGNPVQCGSKRRADGRSRTVQVSASI
jgi:hypothetical protein